MVANVGFVIAENKPQKVLQSIIEQGSQASGLCRSAPPTHAPPHTTREYIVRCAAILCCNNGIRNSVPLLRVPTTNSAVFQFKFWTFRSRLYEDLADFFLTRDSWESIQ